MSFPFLDFHLKMFSKKFPLKFFFSNFLKKLQQTGLFGLEVSQNYDITFLVRSFSKV